MRNDCVAILLSIYYKDKLCFVKQSIDSLLKQTYSNVKLYICFDGFIDNSILEYLDRLDDNRIFILKRDINKGLAYSLNELLGIVLNEGYVFIARMDADDISEIVRIEKQVNYLIQNKDVDIVGSYVKEIDDDNNFIKIVKYPTKHSEMKKRFGIINPIAHPSVMFRNSFFIKAGIYPLDTDKDEDTMLWLNGFLNDCIFANIPEPLFRFRIDEDFYNRRSGIKKAFSDFKNRIKVIRLLKLKKIFIFVNIVKMMIFTFKSKRMLSLVYKIAK